MKFPADEQGGTALLRMKHGKLLQAIRSVRPGGEGM